MSGIIKKNLLFRNTYRKILLHESLYICNF